MVGPVRTDPRRYLEVCQQIERLAAGHDALDDLTRSAPDEVELAWFRWITGHQVSFVVWRVMAALLRRRDEQPRTTAGLEQALRHCVRSYAAMLLYTGSCRRATYESVIRSSMRLQHRSFSGSWAPDYVPVRSFLRGHHRARTTAAAPLDEAVVTLHLVHDAIAAKLVPDGRSLLHQANLPLTDTRLAHLLYDNYFLTVRSSVDADQIVVQLLRRLVAIAQDVTVNGVHPPGWDEGAEAAVALVGGVAECEKHLLNITLGLATTVARGGPDGLIDASDIDVESGIGARS